MLFSIKVVLECSSSVSVYTTYCGLRSCTVLLALSPGFEEGIGPGEEERVDKVVGVVGIVAAS